MGRLKYISLFQIIGPILVILGHSLNGINITSGIWYSLTKEWIYIFHMPLFFMISGYLLSFKGFEGSKGYLGFIKQKFNRLLLPYLVWNIIGFIPKLFVQQMTPDTVELSIYQIVKCLFYPRQTIWGHTWFLVALFLLYAITPFWKKIFCPKNIYSKIIVMVLSTILYCLPIGTEFLCISDLHRDILFFALGCWLGTCPVENLKTLFAGKRFVLTVFSFVLSVTFVVFWQPLYSLQFIPCIAILITILAYGLNIKNMPSFCEQLSLNSFGIYILHWPVMIVARTVCFACNLHNVITIIIMTLSGFIIPNLIIYISKKLRLNKNKLINVLLGV